MNRLLKLTGAALIGVLLQSGASQANVLLNSGFETGNFSNWTVATGGDATYPQVVIAYNQNGNFVKAVMPSTKTSRFLVLV